MSLKIIKATGVISPLSIIWFIHGYKAVGKSTLFSKFPNTLYITTEKRHDHIKGIEYIYIKNWEDLLNITKLLENNSLSGKYKFIVIDVIDLTYQYCIEYVCKKEKWEKGWKQPGWGKGEDLVDTQYRKWYIGLLTLSYGFAFISHTKIENVEKIINGQSVIKTKVVSGLHDRAKRIIMPPVDITGHMKYETLFINVEGKMKSKEVRVISFEGDDLVEAGDGVGCMPKKLIINKDSFGMYNKIEEMCKAGRKGD